MTAVNGALNALESESIEILREAVASAHMPVMMYSTGKDSSVMLQLARKDDMRLLLRAFNGALSELARDSLHG